MCGITGFKKFSDCFELDKSLESATASLKLRGPDNQSTFIDQPVGLGHTRLSILDTSDRADQPMHDKSGRYTLVYNGEIYNYKELSKTLNTELTTTSDTEVLLYLLIKEGAKCLEKLNGFFAFAFYDSLEKELLIARDKMGIKPLHYYHNNDFFAFGSEMKALFHFPLPKKINKKALAWYMRLTYLPQSESMIEGVRKLKPGHFISIKNSKVNITSYWKLDTPQKFKGDYDTAKSTTVNLLEKSVERRMVADVPLGSFLSGGTDSSAVVAMACKFKTNIHTFSIGYQDHSFFDETNYAELVAEKFKTNHTTFSLTNDDLLSSLSKVIDYIDEPFADSSAIPTYILSNQVSKQLKVALSGDGADELFGGYYKHLAFNRSITGSSFLKKSAPLLRKMPQSRSSKIGNTVRRLSKYANLLDMPKADRYLYLASFNTEPNQYLKEKSSFANLFEVGNSEFGLNDFLDQDLQLVLPGDMLTKVDLMSMANSLEVRVPFLDKDMVNFARSLPADFKVSGSKRKRVLQDAFEHILPTELHHRSKKGFEVPLLHWLKHELSSEIDNVVFNENYLNTQGLFITENVLGLKKILHSNNPMDVHVIIWTIYVFQKWYQNHFNL